MRCIACGAEARAELPDSLCHRCGNLLEIRCLKKRVSRSSLYRAWGPGIWRFAAALPFEPGIAPVSLKEGNTPIVRAKNMEAARFLRELHFKVEGENPTGSFKDRGMTAAVTRAKSLRSQALICASTGNTAASLAAYGARAGIPVAVVVAKGSVATGKLGQAFAYGARVFGIEGNFDAALKLVFDIVRRQNQFYLVNSVNPYRIEGQKVAAYEIYEQLGEVPDFVVLPVGNAGNISAVWKGFRELVAFGITKKLPRMVGVQAEGASPIAEAVSRGGEVTPWPEPRTVASAIRIGSPVSWRKALAAIAESGGTAVAVTDDEILAARRELATKEGILVEAASAAPAAALRKLRLPRRSEVVCIATGNGLKDVADHKISTEIEPLTRVEDLSRAFGLGHGK